MAPDPRWRAGLVSGACAAEAGIALDLIVRASGYLDGDDARNGVQGQAASGRAAQVAGQDGDPQLVEDRLDGLLVAAADVERGIGGGIHLEHAGPAGELGGEAQL